MSRTWTFLHGKAAQFAVDAPQYRLSISLGEREKRGRGAILGKGQWTECFPGPAPARRLEDKFSAAPKGIIKSSEISNS